MCLIRTLQAVFVGTRFGWDVSTARHATPIGGVGVRRRHWSHDGPGPRKDLHVQGLHFSSRHLGQSKSTSETLVKCLSHKALTNDQGN